MQTLYESTLVRMSCAHPYIRKGYYLGIQGDVYVCVKCGEQRPRSGWILFELRRTPPRGLLNPPSQKTDLSLCV